MTPDDERKRRKEHEQGAAARRLMEDPLLLDAYEATRAALLASWEGESEPLKRERLWHELQGLRSIWQKLRTRVVTGQMAQTQLEDLKHE